MAERVKASKQMIGDAIVDVHSSIEAEYAALCGLSVEMYREYERACKKACVVHSKETLRQFKQSMKSDLKAKIVDLVTQTVTLSDGTVIPIADIKDLSFTVDTREWSDGVFVHVEPVPNSERYWFTWMGQEITGPTSDFTARENRRTLWGVTHV